MDFAKVFCGAMVTRGGTLAASNCTGPTEATGSRADVNQVQFWSPPVRNAFRARSALRLALTSIRPCCLPIGSEHYPTAHAEAAYAFGYPAWALISRICRMWRCECVEIIRNH